MDVFIGSTSVLVYQPDTDSWVLDYDEDWDYVCYYYVDNLGVGKPGTGPGGGGGSGSPTDGYYPWLALDTYDSSNAYRAFVSYSYSGNINTVASYSSQGMAFPDLGPGASGVIEVPSMTSIGEGGETISVEGCTESAHCVTDSFGLSRTRSWKVEPRGFQVVWWDQSGVFPSSWFDGNVSAEFIKSELSDIGVLANAGRVQLLTTKSFTQWRTHDPFRPGHPVWTDRVTTSGVSNSGTDVMQDINENILVEPGYSYVVKEAPMSYQWGETAESEVQLLYFSPWPVAISDVDVSITVP